MNGMIYERIRNLKEVVGEDATSFTWPLGNCGGERRNYFLSQSHINTHIHCQPFKEDDPFPPNDGEVCDGFLIRTNGASHKKDQVETAALYSHQIPRYYGRKIDEVVEIDEIGEKPRVNRSENGRRFVLLIEQEDKILAVVPKKIGEIPTVYRRKNVLVGHQGNSIAQAIERSPHGELLKGRVVGLWHTTQELVRTPVVNIEDAWDVAMLTMYSPEIRSALKRPMSRKDQMLKPFRSFVRFVFIRDPGLRRVTASLDGPLTLKNLSVEEAPLLERIIKQQLIGTSRRLANNADRNFLAAYNLHDYLKFEDGRLKPSGYKAVVPGIFGGPEEFLDLFGAWVEEQFPVVKLVWDKNIPSLIISDKQLEILDNPTP